MPGRLMVGHMPLEHGIGVRVPARQPRAARYRETETHRFHKDLKLARRFKLNAFQFDAGYRINF